MKRGNYILLLWMVLSMVAGLSAAAQRLISGRIVAADNTPLAGATVTVKGTTNSTTTDNQGQFSLNSPTERSVLVVSNVGFGSKEISVNGGAAGTIQLESSTGQMDEVVVVGYGQVRKKDLTGAVSSVSSKAISDVPVLNVNQALQGRAAGVLVQQADMRPGGGIRVNIRGISSINNGIDPIYVIDGVITQGNISELNPEDIESIDILKDASAAAIYGARGANGVVIITTKKGRAGRFSLNYDGYAGRQSIIKKLPMMSGPEYAQLRRDADRNVALQDGRAPKTDEQLFSALELEAVKNGRSYDWQDELLRNALMTNHTLSATGGNEKTTFYSSVNFFKQDGIIINSDYQRASLKLNLTHKVSNKFSLGNTFTLSKTDENIVPGGIFYSALSAAPILPFTNADGTYPLQVANNFAPNPVANAKFRLNKQFGSRYFGTVFAEFSPVPALRLRTSYGFDDLQRENNVYSPRTIQEGASRNGYAWINNTYNKYWNWENTATFDKAFGQHRINVVAGATMEENRFNSNTVSAQDFPTDINTYKNLAAGKVRNEPSSYYERWRIGSVLGRINYSFADRYYVTFTARRDGNSKFGPNNKYAFFPSGSVAWRFTEEGFMKGTRFLSDGKLRVSYGASGNPNIAPYRSFTQFVSNNALNYSFNGSVATGLGNSSGVLGNPNIKWEQAKQLNVGLDLRLFDRVSLTLDYFDIQNENLILNRVLPPSSGFGTVTYNIGGLNNKGIDVGINATIINSKDLGWSINANWARYRNKVTSLEGGVTRRLVGTSDFGNNLLEVGRPLGLRWDYLYGGVWQQGETIIRPGNKPGVPGDMKIVDWNGDKKIDAADQTVVGDVNPDWYGGLSTDLTYKSLSLNVVTNFRVGNDVANRVWDFYMDGRGTFINNLTDMNNRWSPSNTNTTVPRATIDFRHYDNSSRYMEDGSYFRFRTITLGWSLPSSVLTRVRMQRARVYLTAVNPITISNYRGYDPEADPSGFGTDTYPNAKSFVVGLNVSF